MPQIAPMTWILVMIICYSCIMLAMKKILFSFIPELKFPAKAVPKSKPWPWK